MLRSLWRHEAGGNCCGPPSRPSMRWMMLYSTGSNATRSWPGGGGRTLLANRIARFLSNKAAAKAQGTRLLALLVVASIAVAWSLCDAAEAGEISVSNDAELLKALRGAKRGDTV